MRIAYLSNNSPENIHDWSGTPYHMYAVLKKHHDVDWIGCGVINGARWYHLLSGKDDTFYPEKYCMEIGRFLTRIIHEGHYDVVITSTYHFCVNLHVDIPVIFVSDVIFDAFKPCLKNQDPKYHELARETERLCLEKVDGIVYSSQWAKEGAIKAYGILPDKIHVVEFGANMPTPNKIEAKHACEEVCNIVFVGRDAIGKGLQTVLDTYCILQRMSFPCQLTVIGCQVNDSENLGVVNYPMIDKASYKDMEVYDGVLRKAHFLILPTKFDAFGIVFCEASAYGVPSIAADVGGVSQPLRDGVNGILLPPDASAETYADTIQQTYKDKRLYYHLSASSIKEFKNRLNWNNWCSRITEVVINLIQEKKTEEKDVFYLPVYVINLPERVERRRHIEKQFLGKDEFEVTFVEAVKHEIGAAGLWNSLRKCIQMAIERGDDIIVVCEDDHIFTEYYSKEYFLSNVIGASQQGAEILSGGISNFRQAIPVSENRYWIDKFFATQFIVLYKSVFHRILEYEFKDTDAEDLVLPELSNRCMVLFPFISEQYDFGHSDVTLVHNERPGLVTEMFKRAKERLSFIHHIRNRFSYI